MLQLLLIGGWVFWSVLAALFLILVVVIEDNKGEPHLFVSSFLTLGVAYAIFAANKEAVNSWLIGFDHYILAISGYIVAGIVWSFYRWMLFVRKAYKQFLKDAAYYRSGDEKGQQEWIKENRERRMPKAGQNKENLTTWMIFWPVSIVRYILGDLVVDFYNFVITRLGKVYDRISESQFKG